MGIRSFVMKPIVMRQIASIIREVLDNNNAPTKNNRLKRASIDREKINNTI